jgi:CHASE2 domain-containing sensor protein
MFSLRFISWLADTFTEARVEGARELFVKALFGFVATGVVLASDPFEIGSRTQRHSRDVFNAIFGAQSATTPSVDDVAVVILNEESLQALELPWPLPYAVHADIIEAIHAYNPAAVIIDILFVDKLRRDPSLAELVNTVRTEGRAKSFLAAAPDLGPRGLAILSELNPTSWGPNSAHAELVSVDEVPPDFSHSPYLLLRAKAPDSAAFSVYRYLCAHGAARNCDGELRRDDFAIPMDIQWPLGTPDHQIGCASGPVAWGSRLWAILWRAGSLDPLRQNCPPYRTVEAELLLQPADSKIESRLETALRGKVVFYGASVTGSADAVMVGHITPHLPGVFVHAAAFENLVRFGPSYLTDKPRIEWATESRIELGLAAAMSLFVFVATRRVQINLADAAGVTGLPPLARRMARVWVPCVFVFGLVTCLCLGAIYIQYAVLSIAPSNWIALITMAGATIAVVEPAIKSR